MAIKQIKISTHDATLGMFVSGLDRPWSQTPFLMQGFLLRKEEELEQLREYCKYVFIDVVKGIGPVKAADVPAGKKNGNRGQAKADLVKVQAGRAKVDSSAKIHVAPIKVTHNVYEPPLPIAKEVAVAERTFSYLRGQFSLVEKQIAKGKTFDYESLKGSVDDMVRSVVRCPEAFAWLLLLRKKDQKTHDHSMRCALWALQFGRYAGMSENELATLCMATLLKDVGKTQLSASLLEKHPLTAAEQLEYQRFVDYGVEILRQCKDIDKSVLSVVQHHCERFDGSGYPKGLKGGQIPVLARVVGIATTYDMLSNPFESPHAISPSKAIAQLYHQIDIKFQEDLVVQFIQSIGLYPAGTMVKLSTGDIGVVVEQDNNSRLTPKVAMLDGGSSLDGGASDQAENYILLDLRNQEAVKEKLIEHGSFQEGDNKKVSITKDIDSHENMDILAAVFSTVIQQQSEQLKIQTLGKAAVKQGFTQRLSGLFQRA